MSKNILFTIGVMGLMNHAKASDSTQFLLDEEIGRHASSSYLKYIDLKGVSASHRKYLADNSEMKVYFKLNPLYCTKDPYNHKITMVTRDGKHYVASYDSIKTNHLIFNEVVNDILKINIYFEVEVTEDLRKRL